MPEDLKKKPEETKLTLCVAFLFIICLAFILSSHILYNQHIGEVGIPIPNNPLRLQIC